MTDSDQRRVVKALQGAEFPADKRDLIAFAETRGAEEKTRTALYALPDGIYQDKDAVEAAVPQDPEEPHGHE